MVLILVCLLVCLAWQPEGNLTFDTTIEKQDARCSERMLKFIAAGNNAWVTVRVPYVLC